MIEVLIVDDDFMVAKIHGGFVQQIEGFTVTGIAHTGADALSQAIRLQPDLVLLDVHLPDINGLELLQGLREAVPELDVLVISAAREAETIRRALRGGIVHYLMKPFSPPDLQERLEYYRTAYLALDESKETIDQSDVNRVFGVNAEAQTQRLPKGFSSETLQLVERELFKCGKDLSTADMAASLGISRVSARRYLEFLASSGKVRVRLRYGEVGRPERRYFWSG